MQVDTHASWHACKLTHFVLLCSHTSFWISYLWISYLWISYLWISYLWISYLLISYLRYDKKLREFTKKDQKEQDAVRTASEEEDRRIAKSEALCCKFVDLLGDVVRNLSEIIRQCPLIKKKMNEIGRLSGSPLSQHSSQLIKHSWNKKIIFM